MRGEALLETSHSSIQEVDERPGTHGSRAAAPILPDRLRACEREAVRGGSSAGRGGGS